MVRRLRFALLGLVAAALWVPANGSTLFDALRARRNGDAVGEGQPAEALEGSPGRKGMIMPPGARTEQDVAYGDDPAQKLDLYIPPDAKAAPIILMVHGGAWMIGDKGNSGVVSAKVTRWLPKGYIVASANYRMARPPNPLDQAKDISRALAFVQSKASSWGGDPTRVLLMGHSSGAHLVALLEADPSIAWQFGAKPWLGAVILDSAALDVVAIMEGQHPRFYDMVFRSDRSYWRDTSPLQRLMGTPKPMLLVCSTRRANSCPASKAFAARATFLGGRATVLPVDLNHGGINIELGQANEYTASVEQFMRTLGLP